MPHYLLPLLLPLLRLFLQPHTHSSPPTHIPPGVLLAAGGVVLIRKRRRVCGGGGVDVHGGGYPGDIVSTIWLLRSYERLSGSKCIPLNAGVSGALSGGGASAERWNSGAGQGVWLLSSRSSWSGAPELKSRRVNITVIHSLEQEDPNRGATRNPHFITVINEPVRDLKGKKRATPGPNYDSEESAGPSDKRPRTTSYSLSLLPSSSSPKISYIDLAEQILSTMETISEKFPAQLCPEGELSALFLHRRPTHRDPRRVQLLPQRLPGHSSQIRSVSPVITLVISALPLVDLLLVKVPALYKPIFRHEGVFHEIEVLSGRNFVSAVKPKDKDSKNKEKEKEPSESPVLRTTPSSRRPRRPRVGLRADARIQEAVIPVARARGCVLASSSSSTSLCFELLQSGMVDGLLQFSTDREWECQLAIFFTSLTFRCISEFDGTNGASPAFGRRRTEVVGATPMQTPFAAFVKKLQASHLMLGQWLRVSTQDSFVFVWSLETSGTYRGISTASSAFATFQAPHDYLRPRVAGLLGSGSRLSGMLAALAASGFTGSPSRTPAEEAPPQPPIAPPAPAAESSSAGASASGSTITRRRSQRLSTKNAPAADASTSDAPVAGSGTDGGRGGVTLPIAEDGSKVEAPTPDGTRVATPSLKDGQPPPQNLLTGTLNSLWTTKPYRLIDHLRHVYGQVQEGPAGPFQPLMLVQKVKGPQRVGHRALHSPPYRKTLRMPKYCDVLRGLHQLNTLEAERSMFIGEKRNLPESAFVNNKLTAKLTRQLEEPMIVARWIHPLTCLPQFASACLGFGSTTAFGYARLILKWQSQQARVQDTSRRDEGIRFLSRLQRQKVRISRKHILESAVKVFELYGSSSSVLEVEYFEEVGTGLGPTLEFYSLVSKEFARKDLKIWRDADTAGTSPYVNHPSGLYPAPISPQDIASDGGHYARFPHHRPVVEQDLKIVLGEVPLTIATLKLVDISLANSLDKIQNIVAGMVPAETDKLKRKVALLGTVSIDDLALDFTIPGYDIELRPSYAAQPAPAAVDALAAGFARQRIGGGSGGRGWASVSSARRCTPRTHRRRARSRMIPRGASVESATPAHPQAGRVGSHDSAGSGHAHWRGSRSGGFGGARPQLHTAHPHAGRMGSHDPVASAGGSFGGERLPVHPAQLQGEGCNGGTQFGVDGVGFGGAGIQVRPAAKHRRAAPAAVSCRCLVLVLVWWEGRK
ncbi:hypothetical protein B0H11DRAFT_2379166 [Mycena galericulata]|nr:hypothetical protein B0H11DRAFT_2379166 [Mycena galericulata]